MTGKKIAAMTRRDAVCAGGTAGAMMLCRSTSLATGFEAFQNTPAADVDHIMWGARDLDEGIAFIEARTGVRAVFGGVHPKRGTRNALLSLGPRQYLEIISLDPAQRNVRDQWAIALENLAAPRILTWAAGTRDIQALDRKVRAAGLETSGIIAGSREKPDGTVLRWKTLSVGGHDGDVVPFVIEWDAGSAHPSVDSPAGCTIRALRLEHPDPGKTNRFLEALGLQVRARQGPRAGIAALLSTPRGDVELT